MKYHLLWTTAAVAGLAAALVAIPSFSAAQTPPMGGSYKSWSPNPTVITIPVNDPSVKAIAGALFKPAGAGPFATLVYMSDCKGLSIMEEREQEKPVFDDVTSKGFAMLIVDPFTPRGERDTVCSRLTSETWPKYSARGGSDAIAAINALKAMPDIDPKRIFLQGYGLGANSSLVAVDSTNPASRDTKVAGVIAYYPLCDDKVDPTVPTLIMIGDRDDWTPAAACEQLKGKPNVELVVYPGATYAFTLPLNFAIELNGRHIAHDEKATQDAQARADAFMAAHMK